MKKSSYIKAAALCAVLFCSSLSSRAQDMKRPPKGNKPQPTKQEKPVSNEEKVLNIVQKKVFLFGTATNIQDSVTYMTEIVPIEGAAFDKKTGFMVGMELYSDQLRNYLLQQ